MNINWKLRLQNKTTLIALLGTVITFVYQILGLLGVVPGISESTVVSVVGILVNLLVSIGVVVDPTTKGVSDSQNALGYEQPK